MRALVIGLAVSGRAAVERLRADGYRVTAYDARPEAASGVEADRIVTGEWTSDLLQGIDLVVPSPGVPETAPPIVDSLDAGVTVWSELELGWRALEPTATAAVTGTNGKTTVAELASAMLVASGMDAPPVGNIGDPISGSGAGHDAIVVEASSFQLRFVDRFAPDVAAIVNFAPDHLDWHPDVASYAAAKARVFENMEADAPVVYDMDDAGAAGIVSARNGDGLIGVSGTRRVGGSGPEAGSMWLAGHAVSLGDLVRSDPIMLVDMAVAAELAVALGATGEGIVTAALGYVPGRHRREVVLTADGVTWVDDSKATNPHAALAAIESYPSVVLIAGGLAKGLDVRPLARAEPVRGLIVIGESASVLAGERPDAVRADSMDDAVEQAAAIVRSGDVVLLAPGCASFDMFESYGHRGDVFADAVRRRMGE